MKSTFVRRVLVGTAAALALMLPATAASADPVLSSGFDPAASLKGAARFRSFNSGMGREVLVGGVDASGNVTPRNDLDLTWTFPRTVTVAYDATTGNLTATVAGLGSVSRAMGPLGPLNYLEIKVAKTTPTTSVGLTSLVLNGESVPGSTVATGPGGDTKWNVTGVDLTSGFTFSAVLNVVGLVGGADSNHVQITAGYVEPSDLEGPLTSNVVVEPQPVILNGSATVTATVDDSTTGGSAIASAHYQVDGGAVNAMSAQDGAFDEVVEDVEATFTAADVGTREVCVHGTDALNNPGDPSCQTFLVTYQFDGFFSPIDNSLVNSAKAGQAIPAKWRLTDANGAPIEDAASFAGFFSYPISCATLSGDIADSVEEYAAGSSGLQYNGDGYWQYNWKTPRDYANTCRAMYVQFDSGATSPVVKVQFKK